MEKGECSLEASLSESSARLEGWLAAEQPSPSQRAERNERMLLVTEAVEALPEMQRDAVVLHYLGFDDPRFQVDDCDLCGNSAFREGYKEQLPQQKAFETAPAYAGYLQKSNGNSLDESQVDALVKSISDHVIAALQTSK